MIPCIHLSYTRPTLVFNLLWHAYLWQRSREPNKKIPECLTLICLSSSFRNLYRYSLLLFHKGTPVGDGVIGHPPTRSRRNWSPRGGCYAKGWRVLRHGLCIWYGGCFIVSHSWASYSQTRTTHRITLAPIRWLYEEKSSQTHGSIVCEHAYRSRVRRERW